MIKMLNNKKKTIKIIVAIFIFVIVLVSVLLHLNIGTTTNPDLISRGIDSIPKLIINGYLGQFFRFDFFGFFNWLIIPIFVWYLYTYKKRENWERALLFVYFFGASLMAVQGYSNYRYQATFFPFTLFVIIYEISKLFDKMGIKFGFKQTLKIMTLTIACVFLFVLKDVFYKLESHAKMRAPYPSISFVKYNLPNQKFLVNGLPFFYYHTENPALYYTCYGDYFYTKTGKLPLLKNRNGKEIAEYLIDSLNCNYIFSFENYNSYNPKFHLFLKNYTIPLYKDLGGFTVNKVSKEKINIKFDVDTMELYSAPGYLNNF